MNPRMIIKIFNEVILPRVVYLPYIFAKSILVGISIVHRLTENRTSSNVVSAICIEGGVRGWESIEFKELYQSACEYLQPDNVHRLEIEPNKNYLEQVVNVLEAKRFTHFLYDPRTGSQRFWLGLWQSLRIAILFQKHNVVPIVFLTDLSVRTWRSQSAVVSAQKGLVVSFMSPKCVGPIFPHSRLLGPCLMPFSVQTKQTLDALIKLRPVNIPAKALFAGSLYEPRTSTLEKIRIDMAVRGLVLEIKGRVIGSARMPDSEYWARLCYSDIVVTTADQMMQKGTDWVDIPHLVYRYLEVMASGALLVAQDVPGVRRYFIPGEHFISFDSPESAVDVISYFLENDAERLRIARQGKERADALISSRCFWMLTDAALGSDSIF